MSIIDNYLIYFSFVRPICTYYGSLHTLTIFMFYSFDVYNLVRHVRPAFSCSAPALATGRFYS